MFAFMNVVILIYFLFFSDGVYYMQGIVSKKNSPLEVSIKVNTVFVAKIFHKLLVKVVCHGREAAPPPL